MSTGAIDAVKRELESARHALRGAEDARAAAFQKLHAARDRVDRARDGEKANQRNVERLEKALALLEGDADE